MGFKRFAYVLGGSVAMSIILLNLSEAVKGWGLAGVVYFTAFSMCIAVLKPGPGEQNLRWEGGSVGNTFALIFFVAAPLIGSIAWYLTVIVNLWVTQSAHLY